MSYETFDSAVKLTMKKIPFEILLMASMRAATSTADKAKLEKAFPDTFNELIQRQNTKDGHLSGDA